MSSTAKLGAMQFSAGGAAGFVEVSLMHPLDLIKTRFQVQQGRAGYTSVADCARKMYKAEGLLSFYKGILPPILAETPKRAVKFFTFEQYKKLFMFGSTTPGVMTFTLAGLCAGLTEAVVINPFEVVKVKLQAEKEISISQQNSAFTTAREIVKANGFGGKGLNKGLTSTLGRNGVFNMVYFSFYHNVKGYFPKQSNKHADLFQRFLIGLTGGTLASCVNIPFDVAKSRIQGPQPDPVHIKYKTCFATMKLIYKEEGFAALYKGLVPKVMRLGPGGAIMLIVYDAVIEYLLKRT